jgi:hypothetical protein
MRAGNPIKTQSVAVVSALFGYFEEKRGTKRVEREIGRYFNETYTLSALLAGNQSAPSCAESDRAALGGKSLRKIHDDLGFDRACQRVGMSLWWTTLVLGFGALLGNFVAHLF